AEEAAREGGTACAVLNAANEEAVKLFLEDRIGFHDIPRLVARAREEISVIQDPTLEDILSSDQAGRELVWKEFA
ncbi:MAG: 1-deoxy-D-xylulose-5-phosphate reductoisomerase, partial [Oscillibacter sp.]|nr:1-deoxy-D-xylulose-5-phosphate reductoisomerase [Oscillibacter sp.]